MNFIKWLFGDAPRSASSSTRVTPTENTAHYQPYHIAFDNQHHVPAIRVPVEGDPRKVIERFGIPPQNGAIFITGGAGLMEAQDAALTQPIIEAGLAKFAQEHQIAIVDGGTDAGVMKLIGDARAKHGYTFPLIGVAPYGTIAIPPYTHDVTGEKLNAGHSHFVFTDGDDFGQESPMIAALTTALTKNAKIMGIIINGGEIARQETYDRVMKNANIPLIALDGSGRFADEIAEATRGIKAQDARIETIIDKSQITTISLTAGAEALYTQLRRTFAN